MSATTKNQLQDTNADYVYDAAGNLTQPGPIGGPYIFDAENHLISAGGMAYLYDGDGNLGTDRTFSSFSNRSVYRSDGGRPPLNATRRF
ncbi:MAG: hypothetical protein ACYDCG_10020 [Candidatus Acidiferrales bacterium]